MSTHGRSASAGPVAGPRRQAALAALLGALGGVVALIGLLAWSGVTAHPAGAALGSPSATTAPPATTRGPHHRGAASHHATPPPTTARTDHGLRPADDGALHLRPPDHVPRLHRAPAQQAPTPTATADTTITTTQNLLVGPPPSSTSSTTVAGKTAVAAVSKTTSGGSSDPKVWSIVGALVFVALVLGFVTFRYWRRTRPGLEGPGSDDGPDEGDGDSVGARHARVGAAAGLATATSSSRFRSRTDGLPSGASRPVPGPAGSQ